MNEQVRESFQNVANALKNAARYLRAHELEALQLAGDFTVLASGVMQPDQELPFYRGLQSRLDLLLREVSELPGKTVITLPDEI